MSRSLPWRGFLRLCTRYAGSAPLTPRQCPARCHGAASFASAHDTPALRRLHRSNVPLAATARLPSPLRTIRRPCAAYAAAMSRSLSRRGFHRLCARYAGSAPLTPRQCPARCHGAASIASARDTPALRRLRQSNVPLAAMARFTSFLRAIHPLCVETPGPYFPRSRGVTHAGTQSARQIPRSGRTRPGVHATIVAETKCRRGRSACVVALRCLAILACRPARWALSPCRSPSVSERGCSRNVGRWSRSR